MNLSQMKYLKQQRGYSFAKLAELSGVPQGTIQKIFNGETKSPRFETLQNLELALTGKGEGQNSMIEEPQAVYKAGIKQYDISDYYALPDERRVELIDGQFYDMTAPYTNHQIVVSEIFFMIKSYIRGNKGECIPFIAPTDVQLDCDEYTMVEPDICVVCDKDKVNERCIMGAPDWVIEVVSKSTKRKDATIKLAKYRDAGTREYWLVDPDKKRLVVYFFEEDELPVIYGFDQSVPVGIYGGQLQIDFREVSEFMLKH